VVSAMGSCWVAKLLAPRQCHGQQISWWMEASCNSFEWLMKQR
jgi:hypothetical protein